MVQFPVLFRVVMAEEIPVPVSNDDAPTEHGPVALKLTSCMFGELLDIAVAVTVSVEFVIDTELGNWPRTIVWFTASTAGTDGALERGVEPVVSGTSVVAMV
jgi:hypothetical protein